MLLALLVVLLVPVSANASVPCGPRQAKTLAQTERARVFARFPDPVEEGEYTEVYGCFTGRRAVLLAPEGETVIDRSIRIAGRYVVFAGTGAYDDASLPGSLSFLRRFDLRRRRVRVLHGTGLFTNFFDVVLKRNGSTAWISEDQRQDETYEPPSVWRLDSNGRRRLDSGDGIERESLTRRGSTIYWRRDGRVVSAPLR